MVFLVITNRKHLNTAFLKQKKDVTRIELRRNTPSTIAKPISQS